MARLTGLEPATSGVTGRHSNQLSYNRRGGDDAPPECGGIKSVAGPRQAPLRGAGKNSARRTQRAAVPKARLCGCSAARSIGRVNQNRLPTPTVLSTPIVPPSASTSCLEIARPSPVPP